MVDSTYSPSLYQDVCGYGLNQIIRCDRTSFTRGCEGINQQLSVHRVVLYSGPKSIGMIVITYEDTCLCLQYKCNMHVFRKHVLPRHSDNIHIVRMSRQYKYTTCLNQHVKLNQNAQYDIALRILNPKFTSKGYRRPLALSRHVR